MAADPTYLDMPDDVSSLSEQDLSDLDALSAAERALQGARGAEFSARVARSNAEACRIESSSAEISAGTARLAASGADACADHAEIWADMSRLEADCAKESATRAEISARRAEKALHDVQYIGWSVALVGVGMLLGLTVALLLYVIAVRLPHHPDTAPVPAAGLYLRTSSHHSFTHIQQHRHADLPNTATGSIRP